MLRFFFSRSSLIFGSSVAPSTPQFQLLLSLVAVAIVFAVGLVVVVVVGDEVVQREAVVAGDEIDAGVRPAAAPFIEIAGAAEARGEFGDHAAVALPEPADRVAVAAVPFRPQRREIADLIAALAQVPGLGDQLDLRDDRVLVDDVEKRRPACRLRAARGPGC